MQFSFVSIAISLLASSLFALAAPAAPAALVPAHTPPVGVKLYNATAGYNATHGLPYKTNVHGPLTQRDLKPRQAYSGDATWFYPGLGACGGTNNQWEHVVALNSPQWNNGANCWRSITIQANGKQVPAAIVDLLFALTQPHINSSNCKLTAIMQTWRSLVVFLAVLLTLLQITFCEVVPENTGGLLPEGDGDLKGSIDFTNAEDVMEKLGPVITNPDGSMSRIGNWKELTKRERATYLKKLAKGKTTAKLMKSKDEM
ncbi:hypothetical protein RSOLAG1IB_09067 [Rhizoctonia solani AG-1 IB]|uniref:Uncharacterized protein n=1 Tax=Thanatephorus cucumeris (strain AG1-IB / isolate 7/3/14) TaxID=1108050 RepID=A0A0B7FN37_THACB|nr:hypothetical protein RSOLAG1IB_09067 [Rhizoctonia solani AG-1 IB]